MNEVAQENSELGQSVDPLAIPSELRRTGEDQAVQTEDEVVKEAQ